MNCTSRTIKEACDRATRFERSIKQEILWDMYDKESARSILGNVYAMGYMDAKSISGKWNNPIPTWDDTKAMLNSIWNWLCNRPRFVYSRFGRIGNRKIVVFIKRDIQSFIRDTVGYPCCKMSRNGFRLCLKHKLDDKYIRYGVVKRIDIVNEDPDADKCIWVKDKGIKGYVEVYLRNCNEVIKIEYDVKGNVDIGIPEVELKVESKPLVSGYMKYMIGDFRIDRDEYWRLNDVERQALHDKHNPGSKAIPFDPQFAEKYGKNPKGPF